MGASKTASCLFVLVVAACGADVTGNLSRLSDADVGVRREAALALASAGEHEGVRDALLGALLDDDPGVRDAAAASLVRLDPKNLRAAVTGAEEALGEAFAEVLPDAIDAAYDADDLNMFGALPRAMLYLAPHGEGVLRDLLTDDRDLVRSWAAAGLATQPELSDETVELLGEALDDDEEIVVIPVLHALRSIGPRAEPLFEAILPLLSRTGSDSLHMAAAETLGAIGPGAAKAVKPLVEALAAGNYDVSSAAADALAGIGRAAVPALVEALSHSYRQVRMRAADALGEIGADASLAVRALAAHASDDDAEVQFRGRCAIALGKIGSEAVAAKDALIGLLAATGSDDEEVAWLRVRAAEALGLIGPGAKSAVPSLEALLDADDFELRVAAARAICRLGGENDPVVRPLLEVIALTEFAFTCEDALAAIDEMSEEARRRAESSLVSILLDGGGAAPLALAKVIRRTVQVDTYPKLLEKLSAAEPAARISAALALSRVHPPAQELLERELAGDDPLAREHAARAFEQIGLDAMSAVPALLELLIDPDEDVRMAAAWAIAAIDPERAAKSREIDRIRFGGSITEEKLRRIARTIWETR